MRNDAARCFVLDLSMLWKMEQVATMLSRRSLRRRSAKTNGANHFGLLDVRGRMTKLKSLMTGKGAIMRWTAVMDILS